MSESFQSQDIILKQTAEKSYDICMISGQIVIMDDLTKNNTTSIFQMKNKTAGTADSRTDSKNYRRSYIFLNVFAVDSNNYIYLQID